MHVRSTDPQRLVGRKSCDAPLRVQARSVEKPLHTLSRACAGRSTFDPPPSRHSCAPAASVASIGRYSRSLWAAPLDARPVHRAPRRAWCGARMHAACCFTQHRVLRMTRRSARRPPHGAPLAACRPQVRCTLSLAARAPAPPLSRRLAVEPQTLHLVACTDVDTRLLAGAKSCDCTAPSAWRIHIPDPRCVAHRASSGPRATPRAHIAVATPSSAVGRRSGSRHPITRATRSSAAGAAEQSGGGRRRCRRRWSAAWGGPSWRGSGSCSWRRSAATATCTCGRPSAAATSRTVGGRASCQRQLPTLGLGEGSLASPRKIHGVVRWTVGHSAVLRAVSLDAERTGVDHRIRLGRCVGPSSAGPWETLPSRCAAPRWTCSGSPSLPLSLSWPPMMGPHPTKHTFLLFRLVHADRR